MLPEISSRNVSETDFFKKPSNLGSNNPAKKIILASKGEAGYNSQIDLDDDGIITLDEFNQFCEENSVSEESKQKLLQVMQMAKNVDGLQKASEKAKEEANQNENKKIYARRGEDKYEEKMDENKDSIVTYEEYMKYCEKVTSKKDESKTDETASPEAKKATEAYNKKEENYEISVESEA